MSGKNLCFSGCAPDKFTFALQADSPEYQELICLIDRALAWSVADDCTNFYCGMSQGFDLLCADRLLLRRHDPDYWQTRLIAVLPFKEYTVPMAWRELSARVLRFADETICLPFTPGREACLSRNRYMVDRSSRLICWYDGACGETAHTLAYAREQGVAVMNLARGTYESGVKYN